jgi:D-alanyl-lipoteichoic acid acyltransferase DltB (MBOAT superfamily)
MSYVIDVYRGELEPQKSYAEYLSFVAFFPHLVAGPIVRPRDLLPQLAGTPHFGEKEASEGLFLIAMGLGKKILIGDYLALNLVDRVFDSPTFYSAGEVYAAVVGYALQIYCDFSGYTDIAIGSALLLGVRFPKNFNSPYKAASVTEFWRRWHISLSTWLRDYLYIPLGGNRRGRVRTYMNLLTTMILGGLWHGAAWTFVAWGTLHGVALAGHRLWTEWRGRSGRSDPRPDNASPAQVARSGPSVPGQVLRVFFTFHFVCACWVFFRADTFGRAWLIFERLGSLTLHHENLPLPVLSVLALGLIGHYVPDSWFEKGQHSFLRLPGLAQGALLFLLAIALRKMASADAVPFVYFQF